MIRPNLSAAAVAAIVIASAPLTGAAATLFANGGFEAGTTAGWTTTGDVSVVGHALDPYTNATQDRVWEREYAARVGNDVAAGGGSLPVSGDALTSTLSQTAVVPSDFGSAVIAFSFAGVHPGGDVAPEDLPGLHLVVRNLTDDETLLEVVWTTDLINDPTSGFEFGPVQPEDSGDPLVPPHSLAGQWVYRPWTAVELRFDPDDVGDEILLELIVHDSADGGLPAYARFDELVQDFSPQEPPADAVIPEPATLALLGLALPLAVLHRRRRTP